MLSVDRADIEAQHDLLHVVARRRTIRVTRAGVTRAELATTAETLRKIGGPTWAT